jgi:23S rRNA (adenine2503-C2)-methyltransferase
MLESEVSGIKVSALSQPSLSELNLAALQSLMCEHGLAPYRAGQVFAALWKRGAQDISELTELPFEARTALASAYRVRTLEVRAHLRSQADGSEKVVFGLRDGTTIETVLIPGRNASGRRRLTVCVSSQVGCPAACTFCATGLSGFARNLSAGEIADQVMFFAGAARFSGERIDNVVFMGMGEPLLNVPNVREAVRLLLDSSGLGMGDRHITISTVGIVPQLRRFAEWAGQVNLAISLHAPSDDLRSQLVPYNRHFPISEIIDSVAAYVEVTGRRVSFEYVLLRGVNDGSELARDLAQLLRPLGPHAHVNVIPWNPFREGRFERSEGPDADRFARIVRQNGINTTIRYSKGLDISAACGQLREQVQAAPP